MVRDVGTVSGFKNWFPIRIFRSGDAVRVHWFRRDESLRFDDRYFHETVARAAKRPFNLSCFRETGPDELHAVASSSQSLPTAGFIAHLSRCGSTLVSSAFASRDDTLVLAEAGPINDVLYMAGLPEADRVALLRSVVGALVRPQRAEQRAAVVKLDAWHASRLDTIERAFPSAPWIFIHRNPLEVLVSHLRTQSFMMSAANAPATLGISPTEAMRNPREVHCAQVIASVLTAVERRAPDREALVDYRDLPEAIWSLIGPRFGLPFSAGSVERIRLTSKYHAKHPHMPFVRDADEKRQAAEMVSQDITGFLNHRYAWFQRTIVQ